MTEAILAALALAGSPAGSPAPALTAAGSLVAGVEIAATDNLPSLDDIGRLPSESARNGWNITVRELSRIEDAIAIGAINMADAKRECEWRRRVWAAIYDAVAGGWEYFDWDDGGRRVSQAECRRRSLARLRDLLGDAAYLSGDWPSPSIQVSRRVY